MPPLLIMTLMTFPMAGEGRPARNAAGTPFAVDLYQQLNQADGNLFFSPASLTMALAMVYQGARGTTAEQLSRTLHVPDDPEQLARTMGSQLARFNSADDHEGPLITLANALWLQQGVSLRDDYQQAIATVYQGHIQNLDFIHALEPARLTINTWVARQTRDKIPDLIKPGVLTPATRLVLTNAIYFKAAWQFPFHPDHTRVQPFHLATGPTIDVSMMNQEAYFPYQETEQVQILQLPYQGRDLTMLIVLPKTDRPLSRIETALDPNTLGKWQQAGTMQRVNVSLPRFKFTQSLELRPILSRMGMSNAFQPDQADFSGITGKRDLYLSDVIHQAFVAVDEAGTEAAAATGMTMSTTSLQPPVTVTFRADHPFLFLIQSRQSGDILFMGRVSDPSHES